MANQDCVVGATLTKAVSVLEERVEENRQAHDDMWEALNALRNRLPLWATLVFALLTSTVTGLLVALMRMQ